MSLSVTLSGLTVTVEGARQLSHSGKLTVRLLIHLRINVGGNAVGKCLNQSITLVKLKGEYLIELGSVNTLGIVHFTGQINLNAVNEESGVLIAVDLQTDSVYVVEANGSAENTNASPPM